MKTKVNTKTIIAALFVTITVMFCNNDENGDREKYQIKASEDLKSASEWLIQEGVEHFSIEGKNGLRKKLRDEWMVSLWATPLVEAEPEIFLFSIKTAAIYYDVVNLFREEVNGNYYEFWIVKVRHKYPGSEIDHCDFYVTRASEVFGRREIVMRSKQFIPSYDVSDELTIKFPSKDLSVLYTLKAWVFPDNYRKSDLKYKKIIVEEDLSLSIVDLRKQ